MMFRHPHPLAETTDASTADAEKDRWTAGPSTTLRSGRDDKGEGRFRGEQLQEEKPFFIILGGPPMIPPVGMTTIFRCIYPVSTELSSRPERSVVEGPAVFPAAIAKT
jgi:hypothetical protein